MCIIVPGKTGKVIVVTDVVAYLSDCPSLPDVPLVPDDPGLPTPLVPADPALPTPLDPDVPLVPVVNPLT